MNISTVLGKKGNQTQAFLENGKRIPLTRVLVNENSISQVKKKEEDGYMSVQVAFGEKNKISKPLTGHLKKAGLEKKPRFLREIRVDDVEEFEPGKSFKANDILKAGDIIDVVGTSKGKGFAGVIKRWGFHGGPKTHGQSDRRRAPGAIGQAATPSRVHKGKKMAGRMGNDRVTIKNLEVIEVNDSEIVVKGLVPGAKGSVLMITKIGENKNFKPLHSPVSDEAVEEAVGEVETPTEEVKEEVKAEAKEEVASENDAPLETKKKDAEDLSSEGKTSENTENKTEKVKQEKKEEK